MQNIFTPYGNAFQMYGYQPTQNPVMPQAPIAPTQLVKVSGVEGARAYQMAPNSSVALFHESEDTFYVKTTDGAGFPTIRTFRFEPVEEQVQKAEQYVTLDEFNRFKEELYAKQSVRAKKPTATTAEE